MWGMPGTLHGPHQTQHRDHPQQPGCHEQGPGPQQPHPHVSGSQKTRRDQQEDPGQQQHGQPTDQAKDASGAAHLPRPAKALPPPAGPFVLGLHLHGGLLIGEHSRTSPMANDPLQQEHVIAAGPAVAGIASHPLEHLLAEGHVGPVQQHRSPADPGSQGGSLQGRGLLRLQGARKTAPMGHAHRTSDQDVLGCPEMSSEHVQPFPSASHVRIRDQHPGMARPADPRGDRGLLPLPFRRHHLQAGPSGRHRTDTRRGAIGAGIVHHDHLIAFLGQGLLVQVLEQEGDGPFGVPGRHHHTDGWTGRSRLLPGHFHA